MAQISKHHENVQRHRRAAIGNSATKRAVVQLDVINRGPDATERKLAAWQKGADELEIQMRKIRGTQHEFVPMGRLPGCEACGAHLTAEINGKRIHI